MIAVLCYHKISNIRNDYNMMNVTPENFRQQMKFLSEQYRLIPLKDVSRAELLESDQWFFAVTFDDGYSNVCREALPILEESGVPATLFVTTENLGTNYENWTDNIIRAIFEPACKRDFFECSDSGLAGRWYVKELEEKTAFYRKINYLFRHTNARRRKELAHILLKWAELPLEGYKENRILSVRELKQLADNPLITIGTHCVTHPFLGALTDEEQEWEISESIKTLEEITGYSVTCMAYPFGSRASYHDGTIRLLKKYGIAMAFTTLNERLTKDTDLYQLPRVVMGNYNLDDFKHVVSDIILKSENDGRTERGTKAGAQEAIDYVGSIEGDTRLLDGKKKIVVWGCGFWGRCLYNDLKLLNLHVRVIAFGDNDLNRVGRKIENVMIMSKTDIMRTTAEDDLIVLVKNSHDLEIYDDLKKCGFKEVHLIVRT